MDVKLILGSQSPRRKEILSYFSLPFVQIPSLFNEDSIQYAGDPKNYATTLSQHKAHELASRFPEYVILTADTIVHLNGKVYNKPGNPLEAQQMLKDFSGNWQEVYTAVTVRRHDTFFSDIEETRILFHNLTDAQITHYHKSCNSLDKAGGYSIQHSGGLIVSRMEGCYDNVLGLPINTLRKLLLKMGIDLWLYLK